MPDQIDTSDPQWKVKLTRRILVDIIEREIAEKEEEVYQTALEVSVAQTKYNVQKDYLEGRKAKLAELRKEWT